MNYLLLLFTYRWRYVSRILQRSSQDSPCRQCCWKTPSPASHTRLRNSICYYVVLVIQLRNVFAVSIVKRILNLRREYVEQGRLGRTLLIFNKAESVPCATPNFWLLSLWLKTIFCHSTAGNNSTTKAIALLIFCSWNNICVDMNIKFQARP